MMKVLLLIFLLLGFVSMISRPAANMIGAAVLLIAFSVIGLRLSRRK